MLHKTMLLRRLTWLLAGLVLGVEVAMAWVHTAQAEGPACQPPPSALSAQTAVAGKFANVRTVHLALNGEVIVEQGFHGASPEQATNIKSASKTLIAAITGAAIERGLISGVDQRIAEILPDALPNAADAHRREITIGHLLSMQAGLARTSGQNYGAWVASDNWVKSALGQPIEGEPGQGMRYSTGNSHLLSAIVERRAGQASYAAGNSWLAAAGIKAMSWMDDPQGIAFGGNQVAMRPRSLLALGELYRRNGVAPNAQRLLPEGWVKASWQIRGRSRWTGDGYGYGWFIREFAGYPGYYGWGYGGQMLYVIPALELSVAITSNPHSPSGRTGYRDALHQYVSEWVELISSEQKACTLARQ